MTSGLALGAFESWSARPLELNEFLALEPDGDAPSRAQLKHLLGYSVLAPSTHNSVPQAYRIDGPRSRVELFLQRHRVLPASDPTAEEALISLGCAVENLCVAANAHGIAYEWSPDPDLNWASAAPSSEPVHVRVGWVDFAWGERPCEDERRTRLAQLLDRRTVRAEFDELERLSDTLRAQLRTCVDTPIQLDLFESAQEKFAWGKLDESATKHKLEDRAFQRELGHWVLPNEDEQSTRGMRGREFGLSDLVTRELTAQLRGEMAMPVDGLAGLARAGRRSLCSASAIGVLSSGDSEPGIAIRAGRSFQRCQLAARSAGFACAVHTAVCQVAHARAISRATLMPAGTIPHVIFRLGRPRNPADWNCPHSSRPRLEELLL